MPLEVGSIVTQADLDQIAEDKRLAVAAAVDAAIRAERAETQSFVQGVNADLEDTRSKRDAFKTERDALQAENAELKAPKGGKE